MFGALHSRHVASWLARGRLLLLRVRGHYHYRRTFLCWIRPTFGTFFFALFIATAGRLLTLTVDSCFCAVWCARNWANHFTHRVLPSDMLL